ncbi:MAG: GNAT family N-acetyltransferase [Actinomycetia bacterium]|nr:GNAT family N-acetyltransferase [Actinomycetes bacterium]MCH9699857.1 GNAT family N-acetyltransferase [Actinomycetes bacterium]MCH9760491.1 GNAT family N-acetyltransferase [Actinomycetes bacterium]
MLTISPVREEDLATLMPMLRSYCDFYRVDPPEEKLTELSRTLIGNPAEGIQLIARGPGADGSIGVPLGFATIYWTWQTLYASRVGVLNDLYVTPQSRGAGAGRALISHCLQLCREHGAAKLVWETEPENKAAQRLYDGIGAQKSTWLTYELDA